MARVVILDVKGEPLMGRDDKIKVRLPAQVISTSADDITVNATFTNGGEVAYYEPQTPAETILECIANDLGVTPTGEQKARIIDYLEQVKQTYIQEFEFRLGPVRVKVKRSPKMTIKRYGP